MIESTIPSKFTESDKKFLLLAEAMMVDESLVEKRENAYAALDISLATKLERISDTSQKRLNRRFNNLIH